MCGKITQMLTWSEVVGLADLQTSIRPDGVATVTPMRLASVIVRDDSGQRKAVRMRWGLIPPGAKDPTVKPHIHARAETIDVKPAFRAAFAARRGILAVTSFNEGREITPTKTEQHVLTPLDGAPIGIAVVWERQSNMNREPHGGALLTFAMVTVPPNDLIATITDRMPALLAAADWPMWLGEVTATPDEVKALLKTSERALGMQRAAKPPSKKDDGQPTLF